MKDYVYRRTVAEFQERSCELKRRETERNTGFQMPKTQTTEPDYRSYSYSTEREHDNSRFPSPVVYRLYTEANINLDYLTGRYFDGYTLLAGQGAYKGTVEQTTVIEILGTLADFQTVVHLAGDIRVVNKQQSVLITRQEVSRFDITAEGITYGSSAV